MSPGNQTQKEMKVTRTNMILISPFEILGKWLVAVKKDLSLF